jgi:serine/threonine protein kinase
MNTPPDDLSVGLRPEQFEALARRCLSEDERADLTQFLFLRHDDPSELECRLEQLGRRAEEFRGRVEEAIRDYERPVVVKDTLKVTATQPVAMGDVLQPDSELINSRGIRLIEELGRGGAGVVHLAQPIALGDPTRIALKLFHRSFTPAEDAAISDFRDARNCFNLSHPHIVAVYGGGYSGTRSFVTMEYVPGVDLGRWTHSNREFVRPQTPDHVRSLARCLVGIARGLHVVHTEHGRNHYDVKPSNILGCPKERNVLPDPSCLKLGDFGQAGASSNEDSEGATGGVGGTWGYMAPEQLTTRTGCVDVFGLGMTLLHIVVGELPFTTEELAQIAELRKRHWSIRALGDRTERRRQLRELQEDYSRIIGGLRSRVLAGCESPLVHDAVLRKVIGRAIAPNPDKRYKSAAGLADDLERFAENRVTQSEYEYTLGEHLNLFRCRCFRPEPEFEPDRRVVWSLAFVFLAVGNVLAEGLDQTLKGQGVSALTSNLWCSGLLVVLTWLTCFVLWWKMHGKSLAKQIFPVFSVYIFCSVILIGFLVPNDLRFLTQILAVQFGLFATTLGVLNPPWRRAVWVGIPVLILCPIFYVVDQSDPEFLESRGASIMGIFYIAFFLLLASGYLDIRYIIRTARTAPWRRPSAQV